MSTPDAQVLSFESQIRALASTAQDLHAKVVSIKGMLPAFDHYAQSSYATAWDRINDRYVLLINGSQVSATKLAYLIKDYAMVTGSKDVDVGDLVDEFESKLTELQDFVGFLAASHGLAELQREIANIGLQIKTSTAAADAKSPTANPGREKSVVHDPDVSANRSTCWPAWTRLKQHVVQVEAKPSLADVAQQAMGLALKRKTLRSRAEPESLAAEIENAQQLIGTAASQHNIFNNVVNVLRHDIQAMYNASKAVVNRPEPDAQMKLVRVQARAHATGPIWSKVAQALDEWSKLSTSRKASKTQ